MVRRVAAKVFYLGKKYHGSQIQPGLPTVEGAIIETLHERKYIQSQKDCVFRSAGRTDAGVSARGNVISFLSLRDLILPEINACLPPDIIFWAWSYVEDDFRPRMAARRRYKYFIDVPSGKFDLDLVTKACRLLEGTHDFSNFSKPDPVRTTVRTLEKIDHYTGNASMVFDFFGQSFLWKQVRKMVTVILDVGRGKVSLYELNQMVHPNYFTSIEPAPPEYLVLWDVQFEPSLEVHEDPKALQKIKNLISSRRAYHRVSGDIFGELDSGL